MSLMSKRQTANCLFGSLSTSGSERYGEGPLSGRVTLYLFDHPEGAPIWQLEDAVFPFAVEGSRLQDVLRGLESDDIVEVVGGGYGGDMAGYRLTTESWLKIARSVQDVEQTTTP